MVDKELQCIGVYDVNTWGFRSFTLPDTEIKTKTYTDGMGTGANGKWHLHLELFSEQYKHLHIILFKPFYQCLFLSGCRASVSTPLAPCDQISVYLLRHVIRHFQREFAQLVGSDRQHGWSR